MDTPAPLLNRLTARIAQRDLPPVLPVFDLNDPVQFRVRLLATLTPLLPGRNERGRSSQTRMLYEFVAHETRTAAELGAAAGIERVATGVALAGLVRAGLLDWERQGPRRTYRLTRWGEDWLLAVGRAEVPPAKPVAATATPPAPAGAPASGACGTRAALVPGPPGTRAH